MNSLLQVENLDKHYGGVHALRDVSLVLREGEIHALCGENGAGKSTLAKIVAGAAQPDSGKLIWQGRTVRVDSPLAAQRLGIAIIYQELDLFPNLTVGENLVIGNLQANPAWLVQWADVESFCRPYLEQVGLTVSTRQPLGEVGIAQMQLVAIARALSMRARLILMDEPTSSLPEDAVERLFGLVRQLRDRGVSIVYVSHKMREIFAISDRVTVLRDGQFVATQTTAETNVDEIISQMVGRPLPKRLRSNSHATERKLLQVRGLTSRKIENVTFDLHAGEVLGVAGLVGAGRSELGAALFGLDRILSGEVILEDRKLDLKSPSEAIRAGLGLLPEDRKLQGLNMGLSVKHNSSLAFLPRLQRLGFIRGEEEIRVSEAVHRRTRLKTEAIETPVENLSGGNQQKVLLAKWLLTEPHVFFLDDPTRGIDIGAKEDIYALVEELAAQGKGILFVSSELPELLRCCDRILVMHEGREVGIVDAEEATQERIMALATRTKELRAKVA